MIDFDFEADPQSLSEAREVDLTTYPGAALAHTFFLMPVRLAINGEELFSTSTGIFYMANALDTLKNLPQTKTAIIHPPGMTLAFELSAGDGEVRIIMGPGRSMNAPYVELLQAWEAFAERVRSFLVTEFPELAAHPRVGDWFQAASS